jgi:hypothetical protein
MLTFHIGRWQNTYRTRSPLAGGRAAQWDAGLAALDGERLAAGLGADEWVLVRRLDVKTRLGAGHGQLQAGDAWEQALSAALKEALAAGGPNVVRYRDRRDAVADMVYRAAAGDGTRAWAWRRMDLLPQWSGAMTMTALREHAWAALAAEREGIWPLLVRLLRADAATGAFTALVRALPEPRWREVLSRAPQTHPFMAGGGDAPHAGAGVASVAFDSPGAGALLVWACTQPVLARRHAGVVAVMLAALGRAQGVHAAPPPRAVLRAAGQALDALLPGAAPRPSPRTPPGPGGSAAAADKRVDRAPDNAVGNPAEPGAGDGDPAPPAMVAFDTAAAAPDRDSPEGGEALPAAPPLPDTAAWQATSWAGLVFLLQLAPASGVLAHPQVAAQLPAFLWRLAMALGVPEGEAAVQAFCGGWLPGATERDAPAALWAEADALALRTIAAWEQWLAHHAADLHSPRLAAICRRPGRIRFEPGWIEVHLPLDAADARLRRLALDIDPGWLPWLGCVVRICYD